MEAAGQKPQQGDADEIVQQGRQQSAFPPPPPYYRLFLNCGAASGVLTGSTGRTEPGSAGTTGGVVAANKPQQKTAGPSSVSASIGKAPSAADAGADEARRRSAADAASASPAAAEADHGREVPSGGHGADAEPRPLQPSDRSAGRPRFPLDPPPTPADDAPFQMFGELHSAQPGIPPLTVKQLYDAAPDGTIDFREELRRLNRELLFAFVGMLGAVAEAPSQSARSVELVGALARNLQHLLNMLRPHQAAATMEHILRTELREQAAAVSDLRAQQARSQEVLALAARQMAAVGTGALDPLESEGASMDIDDATPPEGL